MTDRVLGGVGTKVLYENERVRVWELALEPGESTAIHRHDHDYALVVVDGDRIAAEPEADTGGPFRDPIDVPVQRGTAVFVEKGGIERARNTGERAYYEVLVEFL